MKKSFFLTLSLFTFFTLIITSCNQKKSEDKIIPFGYGYKNPNALATAKGEIGDFSLLDHNGTFHQLYRYSDAKAIVIISHGNDCPIIQKYALIINSLKKKYESKKVLFFFINANKADTRESLIKEINSYGYEPPILMDPSQIVTESLGITRTSEAVVLTPQNWKILYRGAISDRLDYGVDKQKAQNNYLDDVLNSIVENKKITTEAVPAKGCLISFDQSKISYEKDIGPIIANKCVSCHSTVGGYLPKFENYEKFKSWTSMSRETIFTDRMPPFSGDTHYGKYNNDISLSPEEKRAIIKWLDAGSPRDGKIDPIEKANSDFAKKKAEKENKKKEPIYTVTMKPRIIQPAGENEYVYIQMGEAAPEDMWISGAWATSTNPRQVHHGAMMVASRPLEFYEKITRKKYNIDPNEKNVKVDGDIFLYILNTLNKYERKSNDDRNSNYIRFMVWGAGKPQPFSFHNKGVVFLPKGSYLILETHYMGTGKEELEQMTVKFYGTKTKPKDAKQLHSHTVFNPEMILPAGAKNFEVVTPDWNVPYNLHIATLLGHLHMRGKAVKLEVTTPSGEIKTIASIPNYYYGWQTGAGLEPAEPIAVQQGSKLRAKCYFDNSPENPFNPDPNKTVKWGQRVDRTEMCKMNMTYTID